jgi:hypothetical protein
MMDNFHEKRKDVRRKEDGQLKFLMNHVEIAIRLMKSKFPEASISVLENAVDTIEKKENA